ncbi:MAG: helix-turn-helix transcriptional regulator [Desulfobacterales bacterium]|nr:helix-turn-helix transcriptional regulator [Desulfobacterales bacterium]
MKSTDLFIKSVESYISKKNKQSVIADALNISRPHFNSFLKGKRGFSEEKMEIIAAYFGKTYLEMLVLGQELFNKENNISAKEPEILSKNNDLDDHQDKLHSEVIKKFKQKKLAKECNMKMVELEKLDPKSLEKVNEFLDFQLYEKKNAEKKAAKKKAKGM